MNPTVLFSAVAGVLVASTMMLLTSRAQMGWLGAYLVAINASTFFFYGYDKAISGRRWLRIPERLLHAMAFLGGTLAAYAGQKFFRHKTIKGSFQLWFWIIAVVQATLIVLYLVLWR